MRNQTRTMSSWMTNAWQHSAWLVFSVALLIGSFESPAFSQTVQLPSFSRFSYSGSVLVPVQGATSLGSISRSSNGRTRRGGIAGGGVAFGGGASHSGASAGVTVIDHDAIDRQLRGLPQTRSTSNGHTVARPNNLSSTRTASGTDRAVRSSSIVIDRTANHRRAASQDPDSEGKALVRFARSQYRAGKKASSFNAYQLAISKLSPKLATLAKTEFRRVFGDTQLQPTQPNH